MSPSSLMLARLSYGASSAATTSLRISQTAAFASLNPTCPLRLRRRIFCVDPEFIRDLFAPFGPITIRRMFSGAGIFAEGLMFGLIVRDVIYLKADQMSIPDFEREGCEPFTYTRGKSAGRPSEHALPYWRVPERLYDDPDELAVWARRAFAIAESKKKFVPRRRGNRKAAGKTRK
jgi:DNA transformation protein and related proteins